MDTQKRPYRQRVYCSLMAIISLICIAGSQKAEAANPDATVFFRPHCDALTEDGDTILGPLPDIEELVNLGGGFCLRFEAEAPQTLKTVPMLAGDILDLDIVVYNPTRQPINYVRSWIAYDTSVLEHVSIEMTPNFPLVTPGEADFDPSNGYVMIEGNNDSDDANTNGLISVARVQFRVKIAPPSGTFISFYDIQDGGHTSIATKENGNYPYILGEEPGGLHVIFVQEDTPPPPPDDQTPPDTTQDPVDQPPQDEQLPARPPIDELPDWNPSNPTEPPPDDLNPPLTEETPDPEETVQKFTAENLIDLTEDGEACVENADCESNNCVEDICTPVVEPPEPEEPEEPIQRTAFALLQTRNIRVTTEGSSVFLAWDDLNASSLKAYNIYYGTTTGRYIQRKTVDGSMKNLVLRGLPLGATYYFAIRAVNDEDEESAFSQEVAVEIGNADTSTSPLVENAIVEIQGPTENPIGDLTGGGAISVPGETGTSSTMALLFILCAVVGTIVASKRQTMVATAYNPANE